MTRPFQNNTHYNETSTVINVADCLSPYDTGMVLK